MEMLLTGEAVPAARALSWGLVNRVVPAERLDDEIATLTGPILAASPLTVRIGKEAFYAQLPLSEQAAYEAAVDVMTANACKADAQEGMSAFLGKRSPTWAACEPTVRSPAPTRLDAPN
jgi:enoyl-CoA hydratase/carnithine racemase